MICLAIKAMILNADKIKVKSNLIQANDVVTFGMFLMKISMLIQLVFDVDTGNALISSFYPNKSGNVIFFFFFFVCQEIRLNFLRPIATSMRHSLKQMHWLSVDSIHFSVKFHPSKMKIMKIMVDNVADPSGH